MERTKEERMDIAKTILEQLGGKMFRMMTGATNFMALENGLSFALPRNEFNKRGINYVKIELTPADTYTVTFAKVNASKATCDQVSTHEDIYNDNLRDVFSRATGLLTCLSGKR